MDYSRLKNPYRKAQSLFRFRRTSYSPFAIRHSARNGLTLMELVVAAGIFSIMAIVLTGATAAILRAQREVVRDVRVVDSTRTAIDSITRTLRTVNEEDIIDPPSDTNPLLDPPIRSITFLHYGRIQRLGCPQTPPCEVVYSINNNTLYETDRIPGVSDGLTFPLTGETVEVRDFRVIFRGRGPASGSPCDNEQPRATIILQTRDKKSSANHDIALATTVTLRPLEFCP